MTKIKRELRLRSAVTSSAISSPNIAWAAYEEIPEKMVNANCETRVGGDGVPELRPKSSCFLSLRSAVAASSSQHPEPALSSARSEGAVVDLVACATGRTLVEFFAMTAARPRRSHVGGYDEQSCYCPPARTQPIGTDRSGCPRVARFVRGHGTCASRLL
jgi:hypothetical protein